MNINQVFKSVEPYRIVLDLGLSIKDDAGRNYIEHPTVENERIWMIDSEFISLNDKCPFIAGDVFDFLAFYLGDYTKAVNHILNNYLDLAEPSANLQIDSARNVFVSQLTLQREYFLKLIGLRENLRQKSFLYSDAVLWLSNRNIDAKQVTNIIYAAKGSELKSLLATTDGDKRFQACNDYVVLPYFSNYHTISRLVIRPVNNQETTSIVLSKARHAFFGLHTVRPELEDVRVVESVYQAAAAYSQGRSNGNFQFGVVHPYFDNLSVESQLKLRTGTFIIGKVYDLSVVAKSRGGFKDYYVASEVPSYVQTPTKQRWLDFALKSFRDVAIKEDDITPKVGHVLDSLRFDPETIEHIVKWMIDLGREDLVTQIKKHTVVPRTIFTSNAEIEETSAGYKYRKQGGGKSTLISNFTVRLDSSVWFEESGDLYHYGWMMADDVEYPFCIPRVALEKAAQLKSSLKTAVLAYTDGTSGFQPMTFGGPAYERHLMEAISSQTQNRKGYASTLGIKHLGWNNTHSIFNSPAWKVSIAGLDETLRRGHPFCKLLKDHYQFQKFTLSNSTELVTPPIKSFLALLASMCARLFLRRQFPVVSILNNDAGLNLLCAMFLPFGQVNPIELNTNIRREMSLLPPEVERYPVFGNCQEPDGCQGRSGYIFALNKTGIPFFSNMSKALYDQTYTMSYNICTQMYLQLLREGIRANNRIDETAKLLNDYVLEGQKLIEDLTQYKQFSVFDEDMPNLRSVLSRISFDDLQKYFRLDSKSGTIIMSFLHLDDCRRQDIYKELLQKHPSATMYKCREILMNAEAMTNLLEKFYSRKVTISESPGPQESSLSEAPYHPQE